ncbi:PadR family transcriptional regulator [Prauserella oleivorans]
MSLRYALIALLTSRPMTGYDLSKSFSRSVAHVWHAPDSQIYPELNRMERDGLLDSVEVPWGKKGTKKEYHVTDAGLADFRKWMESPLVPQRQRDPLTSRRRTSTSPTPPRCASSCGSSGPTGKNTWRCSKPPGQPSSTAVTPPWLPGSPS